MTVSESEVQAQKRFCTNCGTEVGPVASTCPTCLQPSQVMSKGITPDDPRIQPLPDSAPEVSRPKPPSPVNRPAVLATPALGKPKRRRILISAAAGALIVLIIIIYSLSGTGSSAWPSSLENQMIHDCSSGEPTSACTCALHKIETQFPNPADYGTSTGNEFENDLADCGG